LLVLFAGLALVACAAPTRVTPSTEPKPRAERPTYTLGEKWIRSDGAYELIRIENDRYIFSAGPGQEIQLTKDLTVARFQRGTWVTEFIPPPVLSWPLEVGKWGTSGVTWHAPTTSGGTGSGGTGSFTWSVDAYEDVRVPAGTFRAFRISQMMGNNNLKLWYAPEVRQFVKVEASSIVSDLAFQVVAVDRPLPAPLLVALVEPKEQSRSTADRLTLTGKVTSGKGVAKVTVTLNGQEVSRQEEQASPKPEVSLQIPLTLQEGRNILLVTAADPEGTTRQEARTLFYEKPAPPPPPRRSRRCPPSG
jgi:hypothetical protein